MRPKRAYDEQRRHAVGRGIPWLLSYAEWLEMWLLSGKWEQRGKGSGEYVMCRKGDSGAYSVRNCYIGTIEENARDRWKHTDEETREIVRLYKSTSLSQREIGDIFGIDQSLVSRIVNGKRRTINAARTV